MITEGILKHKEIWDDSQGEDKNPKVNGEIEMG
jgi:hypothetical protein